MTVSPVTPWTPERKTQAILRGAGVVVLLAGVYLAAETFGPVFSVGRMLWRRDWYELAAVMGGFCLILPFTLLCLYAGWRVIRMPERANPRLLLMAVFILLNLVLYGVGQINFFDRHDRGGTREFLRVWGSLYSFAAMLLCTLLYYASCRGLRRIGAFTAAQQAALSVPPSIQLCGLLGLMLCNVFFDFLHQYGEFPGGASDCLMGFGSMALAYWFYRILYRVLTNWMAMPCSSVPPPSHEAISAPKA